MPGRTLPASRFVGRPSILVDHREVGLGPIKGMQFSWRQPHEGRVFMERDITSKDPAPERVQGDCENPIVMGRRFKRRSHGNFYPQLFAQFPFETFRSALPILDLAAGEFPFERQAHGLAPLGSEYLSILFDDGAGDVVVVHGRIREQKIDGTTERGIGKATSWEHSSEPPGGLSSSSPALNGTGNSLPTGTRR
jgi:hypothetical protein